MKKYIHFYIIVSLLLLQIQVFAQRTLNTSYPVGSTAGAFNVTAGGDASYHVPIEVPPGTNGLVPGVSINYNSGSGNGIMGMGWSLSAGSAITRANADFYREGFSDGIDYDSYDRFTLDGNRLVVISGTYGATGSVYYTESESFVRITAMGTAGTGPQWFKVETKDGKILEYGGTTDSRIIGTSSNVLVWQLSKVTDANGNYMTYTYYNNASTGEYRLTQIDYTGNSAAGLSPYNSVRFTYADRTDINTTYVYGSTFLFNKYLSKIETYNESQKVKEFLFKYIYDGSLLLQEIIESDKSGIRYNSTFMNYYGLEYTGNQYETTLPVATDYVFDDFNGDGKNEVYTNKSVYKVNPENNAFTKLCDITDLSSTGGMITGDFNGDNKADIVYINTNTFSYNKSNGNSFTKTGNYGSGTGAGFNHASGDFNGDGILDLLLRDKSSGVITIYWGNPVSPFSNSNSISLNWGVNQYCHDFNGDGKTEIMTLDASGYKIYEWAQNSIVLTVSGSSPTSSSKLFFGDFNGDGKKDFMSGLFKGTLYNSIYSNISNGNGFIRTSFGYSITNSADQVGVIDVNGDGKDDFISKVYSIIEDGYVFMDFYSFNNFSYSKGIKEIYGYPFYPSDFNGDGIADYLCLDPASNKMLLEYHYPANKKQMLSEVLNGLNNSIQITYKSLSDIPGYTMSTNGSYPIVDFGSAGYVVSNVKYNNGLGGKNEISYSYTGAKMNKQLRSLLGFTTITETDLLREIRTVKTFEINNTYYFPALAKTQLYKTDNTLLTETTAITSTKDFGNKRFFAYTSQISTTDFLYGNANTIKTFEYDNYGNLTASTTDASNINTSSTSNIYTTAGGWCLNSMQSSTTTITRSGQSPYTTTANFEYYANGLLKQKISDPGTSTQAYTNFTYNTFGNIETEKISADGSTGRAVTNAYDSKGRLMIKTTNSQGHFVQNEYDYGLGKVIKTTDHNNLVTQFQYDGFGQLTKTIAPDLNESSVSTSWVTSSSPQYAVYSVTANSPGLSSSITYYDNQGRAILNQKTGLDGRKIFIETAYNNKGQVDYVTLPYFEGESNTARKSFSYDSFGRLKTETAPGLSMSYSYDGLTTTITDNIKGLSYTRVADASGTLTASTDAGGSIAYSYNSLGQVSQITAPTSVITIGYDQSGRQTSMYDPNTGTYTYGYNVYNEMTSQTDPKGRSTTIGYNDIGQPTYCNQGTFNTTYTYKTNGLSESVSASNNISYTYSYGDYLRPSATAENIEGTALSTGYAYNTDGTVSKVTYPGGFAITYHYKNGYLEEIKRADNGASIWKVNAINAKGQITQTTAGNGLVTTKTYNSNGYLTAINTGSGTIQNLEYHYNAKDLMDWRRDNRRSTLTESFGYDALNRLNTITLNGITKSMNYSANGNIQNKADAGTYTYSATRPNAVEKVSGNTGTISTLQQDVTYTTFNKVNNITEGSNNVTFTYGPDYARKKVVTNIGGTVTTRMYSGSYERETQNSITRELYYIVAGGEIVAIFEKKTGVADAMHYVHTDHLGSLNVITNQNGAIEQELSFDAWGNRRSPDTWVNITGTPTGLLTRRGFTGHEHMDEFGIINMNGRLYDPVLGRFLSPDPIIANAGSTQDYNRYSYCVNNPLMFTDPSGYVKMALALTPSDDDLFLLAYRSKLMATSGIIGGGSNTPHIDAANQRSAGTMGYTYDWLSGNYIDNVTGAHVDYQTAQARTSQAASRNNDAERYIVYETGYKNSKGEWVGNGNYGVIRAGIMAVNPEWENKMLNQVKENVIQAINMHRSRAIELDKQPNDNDWEPDDHKITVDFYYPGAYDKHKWKGYSFEISIKINDKVIYAVGAFFPKYIKDLNMVNDVVFENRFSNGMVDSRNQIHFVNNKDQSLVLLNVPDKAYYQFLKKFVHGK